MEDVKKRRQNYFSFWTFTWFLGVQLQEVSPSFDGVSKLEWPRKKIKRTRINFFIKNDVSPAVDVVVVN